MYARLIIIEFKMYANLINNYRNVYEIVICFKQITFFCKKMLEIFLIVISLKAQKIFFIYWNI